MTSKQSFLLNLAREIGATNAGPGDIKVASDYICDALRSYFDQLIQSSHAKDLPVSELATFIINSSALQLISNLLKAESISKSAETHGSIKAAHVIVESVKDVIQARDLALRIAREAGASETTVQ
jgi:hypothetical protein